MVENDGLPKTHILQLPNHALSSFVSFGQGLQREDRGVVLGTARAEESTELVANVLVPSGFEPLRLVRAPYFCAGDKNSPVAALDACVIVLEPTATPPLVPHPAPPEPDQ